MSLLSDVSFTTSLWFFAPLFILGGAYAWWCHSVEQKHLKKIRQRPIMDEAVWRTSFFRHQEEANELAIDALHLLAKALDVHHCQLRPSDRFDRELGTGSPLILDDCWSDRFTSSLEKLLREQRIPWPKFSKEAVILGRFIDELQHAERMSLRA
jgi:hypothetical protein